MDPEIEETARALLALFGYATAGLSKEQAARAIGVFPPDLDRRPMTIEAGLRLRSGK